MKKLFLLFTLVFLAGGECYSEVALNHIFDNNMVIQRDKPVKIWGTASPGEGVQVSFFLQPECQNKGRRERRMGCRAQGYAGQPSATDIGSYRK